MYKFIEQIDEGKRVAIDYIQSVEDNYNIKFPNVLRQYYLSYNGASIKECSFKIQNIDAEFSLITIIPLKYGTIPLEKQIEYTKKNEAIPSDFIPFAVDIGADLYYWSLQSGKVYYISHEDVDNSILVCNSVLEFFGMLNKCSDEVITIPNINNNIKSIQYTLQNINDPIVIQKILEYNGKFASICILFGVVLTIISLLFISISDGLSTIFVFVFGIYTLIFIIIDMINRIKSNNSLKKYDIEILKKELETAIKLNGIDTYLTENYIISNSKTIKITKYCDIDWVFIESKVGTVSQQVAISNAYKFGGVPISAYLKNGEKVVIALVKNQENASMIFEKILKENSDVLIGNTLENTNKYKKLNPSYKIKIDLNKIGMIIVFLIIVISLIYHIITK